MTYDAGTVEQVLELIEKMQRSMPPAIYDEAMQKICGVLNVDSRTNYPAVKVAGFNISRQDDANVWIAREGGEDDGEGGVFSNEVFGAAIAKFYDENF